MRIISLILILGITSCKLFQERKNKSIPTIDNSINSCNQYYQFFNQIQDKRYYYFINQEVDTLLNTFCKENCLINKSPLEVKQLVGKPNIIYEMYNAYSRKQMDSCYIYRVANDDIKYKTKYIKYPLISYKYNEHGTVDKIETYNVDTLISSLSKSLVISFLQGKCISTEYIPPQQNERIGYFAEPKK